VPTRSADPGPTGGSALIGGEVDLVDTDAAGPSVIRGGVMRLAGLIAGTLATVISSAVIIRYLGVVDTGRFVTVMALVVIVGSISDLGLSAVGVREYSVRPRESGQRFLRNLIGMRVAFVLIGLVIAVAFAAATDYTSTMVIGTLVGGVGMVLFVVQQSLTIPLQVRLRFGWVASLQLVFQVTVAIEGIVLALAGAGLLPFFALWIPALIPVLALTMYVGGAETRLLPAVDAREWRVMLREILPYSAAVVLSVLYFRVIQILMSVLSTPTETGYFGVAFRILETATTIPPLLVSSALPVLARAARDDPDRFDYAGRRLSEAMILAGVGLALVVFAGAQFAVDLVGGAKFAPSVDVLRILALALVGTFVIAARGYALLSLGRLRAMMVSNALALAVVFAAGIPLIDAHGAIGGAIALMVAELTLAVSYELALTRARARLRPPVGFLAKVALAVAIAAVIPLVAGLPSLVSAVAAGAVYAAVLIALKAVPEEIRQSLWPIGGAR
jgi:O-antigen/teichoic acid export membrane protein